MLAAAAIATVIIGAPLPVGHRETVVAEKPGPAQGVWLQLAADGRSGKQRLLHVDEDGASREVALPARLDDEAVQAEEEGLTVTPLPGGRLAAVARYLPPGSKDCCREIEELDDFQCCAEWMFAQRGPDGHWTSPQILPHSSGSASWVSEAVETENAVEVAWGERYSHSLHVARAPLGGRLQPAHLVPPPLRRSGAEGVVTAQAQDGGLYEIEEGEGVRGERRLLGDGRRGPLHVIRSPLLRWGTFFPEPGDNQLFFYTAGASDYLIARRAAFSGSLQKPRLLASRVTGSPEETARSSSDGWLLLAMEKEIRGERIHLDAISVSPTGTPRPRVLVETNTENDFQDAIGEHGEWLLLDIPWHGGPVSLHPYSPRCPYRRQKISLGPLVPEEFDLAFSIAVGHRDTFHVIWTNPRGDVELSSVRVICATRPTREPEQAKPPPD